MDFFIKRCYNFRMIHQAIEFAAKKHSGQVRKGTDVPFIVHPMEVMYYLALVGADKETIAAGILHDTVEDTPTTIEEIEQQFGKRVAALVLHETEDKTKPWLARKQENIQRIQSAPYEAMLIACADKLCNLKSIYNDMSGEVDVWQRFTGSKQQTKQYYQGMIAALVPLQDLFIYDRLIYYYKLVFGE